jgi:hypothetical protein
MPQVTRRRRIKHKDLHELPEKLSSFVKGLGVRPDKTKRKEETFYRITLINLPPTTRTNQIRQESVCAIQDFSYL